MRTKIVEGASAGGLYLKAMVGRFDEQDWGRQAEVSAVIYREKTSLLVQEGWTEKHFMILDLSNPGGGRIFHMGGLARHDVLHGPTRF